MTSPNGSGIFGSISRVLLNITKIFFIDVISFYCCYKLQIHKNCIYFVEKHKNVSTHFLAILKNVFFILCRALANLQLNFYWKLFAFGKESQVFEQNKYFLKRPNITLKRHLGFDVNKPTDHVDAFLILWFWPFGADRYIM